MQNISIFIIRQLECSLQMQYLQELFTTLRLRHIISDIPYLAPNAQFFCTCYNLYSLMKTMHYQRNCGKHR